MPTKWQPSKAGFRYLTMCRCLEKEKDGHAVAPIISMLGINHIAYCPPDGAMVKVLPCTLAACLPSPEPTKR